MLRLSIFLLLAVLLSATHACTCDAYEPNSSFDTASAVSSFTANICPALDMDFYMIGVTNTSSYLTITITSDSSDVYCDHFVALASSPSAKIFDRSFFNISSPFTVSVPAGTHYLQCYLRHPTSSSESSYTVSTSFATGACPTDLGESNNMKETAFAVSIPYGSVTAYLCPNSKDEDWYTFNSASYQSIQFFAKAAAASSLFDATVSGDSGLYVEWWNPRGDQKYPILIYQLLNITVDLMPGTYYFRFTTQPGEHYDTGSPPPTVYSFSIQSTTHTCTPSGPTGTSLTSPAPLGNGTDPTTGRFCPVDAVFYLYFDVTADKPFQDYSFTNPDQDFPIVTLYKDGAVVGSLTPRQVPGAAGGGYGADRSVFTTPGRYVIKYTGAGFYTYDESRPTAYQQWQVSVYQSSTTYWAANYTGPDAFEPNNDMSTATSASIPYSATNLNLYHSFDNDYFKFTLSETSNLFVNVTTRYPFVEYSMSPFYTPPPQDGYAIAQFYNEAGTVIANPYIMTATPWSTESKYTFAVNVGPGTVYMRISPAYRAPGHVVWQYGVSVIGAPSLACTTVPPETTTVAPTTIAPTTTVAETTTPPPTVTCPPATTTSGPVIPPFYIEIGFRFPSPIRRTVGPIWESLAVRKNDRVVEIHFRSYNVFNLSGVDYPRINFFFDLDNNPLTGYEVRGAEGLIGSELLLQGQHLFTQTRDEFNHSYLGQITASATMNINECKMDIPISIIRSVYPNASRIRLVGLNDQTKSFAPLQGSFISVPL